MDSKQTTSEIASEIERAELSIFRVLTGFNRTVQVILSISIAVAGTLMMLGVENYFNITIYKEQYYGAFLAVNLCLIFLSVRPARQSARDRVPWYDYLLAIGGLASGFYLTVRYPELSGSMGYIRQSTLVFGGLCIVLVLEALRRLQGWSLVILISVFILYGRFADFLPGLLHLSSTSFPRLITYLYLDPDNMLGLIGIAATIAFAFAFFGQVLMVFGGTAFIRDFSFAAIGQFRGAPAKVAVIASGLFGTINGGAATNVIVTGSFTIPMMKASGYKPYLAGGIEAIASSGGQIMPPVMGVAAFLIAEFLHMPYSQVALAAVIPALLYYLGVFVQVDFDAAKLRIGGLKPEEKPRLRHTLRSGWLFLMPMAILVYFLFIVRDDPASAGMKTSLLTIVISIISKKNRMQFWKKIFNIVESTASTMLTITAVLGGAGFIVAISSVTGLGSVFSLTIVSLAGGSKLVLLITSAIACIILGMGMPTVPAYVLVAVLVGPALTQMGVLPLAAHLFIFYYAVISNVTPPVAIAAYVAAALAQAGAMKTAFAAMRLGLAGIIAPFLFTYSPALILVGSAWQVAIAVLAATVGIWFLSISLSGYLFNDIRWPKRLLAFVIAASFLFPLLIRTSGNWVGSLVGVVLSIPFLTIEWRIRAGRATYSSLNKTADVAIQ